VTGRRHQPDEPPGYDSFLDIVANLVGILVILIIVIGAQAADAMIDRRVEEEKSIDVKTPRQAASSLERDMNDLATKLSRQEFEIAYRRKERDQMQFLVTSMQREIDDRLQGVNQSSRQQIQLQQQIDQATAHLQQLQQAQFAVQQSKPPTQVLQHLPTPMAQTVFGKEVHFRLSKGLLASVPLEELVEQLKKEAPLKDWKLKNSAEISDTIGPIQNFWLNYTLRKTQLRIPTRSGYVVQQAVQLDHFTIVPVKDELGDPVELALQPNSRFRAQLELYDPDRTTITIWVYPDSFHQFRQIKEELFKSGFLCAGRPLPEGLPIIGSPKGSRSAAQ
jgi:hypothetical protein